MKLNVISKRLLLSFLLLFFLIFILIRLFAPQPEIVQIESSYSFPGDTEILTPSGPIPISRISPGNSIYFYNPKTSTWKETMVNNNTEKSYGGVMVTLETDKGIFTVSGDHLFPLISGYELEGRTLENSAVPSDFRPFRELHWILAKDLSAGDILPTYGGEARIKEVLTEEKPLQILYSLTLNEGHLYGVGASGIAAADRSLVISSGSFSDGTDGSMGGCFPAGTPVQTPAGLRYIETLRRGDWVLSQSMEGSWELKQITEMIRKDVSGDILEIRVGEDRWVTATGNHPFLVVEGENLSGRTVPEDIEDDPVDFAGGRWVEARELQEGDVLRTPGGSVKVEELKTREGNLRVYNLKVEENRTYLVGWASLLVHNKGAAEEDSESMKKDGFSGSGIMPDEMERAEEAPGPIVSDEESRRSFEDRPPEESGLKAGYADDNRQFNYFLNFLEEYSQLNHFPLDISERIILKLQDSQGRSYPNGAVQIFSGDRQLAEGLTLADGSFYFFPSMYEDSISDYRYRITLGEEELEGSFSRNQQRELDIILPELRGDSYPQPLDILFILDTTGSMGGEIQRLKDTIELIKMNLSTIRGIPRIRFGLVLYKDRGDSYITRTTALTENLQLFQEDLDEVFADGGGDGPEDLQAALDSAMKRINWDPEAIRLAYVITDAPPHLDYGEGSVKYTDSAVTAREKGIKIFTVGTGGLDTGGEYVLRQISQFTGARYIFLTYGESGESAGGREGSVSHHTGENYQTDKLESIIIQFTREELSHIVPISLSGEDSFYTARPVDWESREETLQKLFSQACGQLADYSSLRLEEGTPTAVIPFSLQPGVEPGKAEFLEAQLQLSLNRDDRMRSLFALVERRNLQQIMEELKLQLTGVISEESSVKIGEFLGARLILSGEVFLQGEEYQLFLKLMRVETGEILSVTKAVVPRELLP